MAPNPSQTLTAEEQTFHRLADEHPETAWASKKVRTDADVTDRPEVAIRVRADDLPNTVAEVADLLDFQETRVIERDDDLDRLRFFVHQDRR